MDTNEAKPVSLNEDLLLRALQEQRAVRFLYNGYQRIGEPHILGRMKGKSKVLLYQTDGFVEWLKGIDGDTMPQELPVWRYFYVENIRELEILEEKFTFPSRYLFGDKLDRYWDEFNAKR